MGLPPRDFKSLASSQFRHPGRTKDGRSKMEDGRLLSQPRSEKREGTGLCRASPPSIFDRPCSTFHPRSSIFHLRSLFVQSGKRDSNTRPQPWQGCALPTELFPRQGEDRNPSRLLQAHSNCLERRATGRTATSDG